MNRALTTGLALSAALHVGLFAAVHTEPSEAPNSSAVEREIVLQLTVSRSPVRPVRQRPPEPSPPPEPEVVEMPPEPVKPVEPPAPKPRPVAATPKREPKPERVAEKRPRKPPVRRPPVKPAAPVQISKRPPEPTPAPASPVQPETQVASTVPPVQQAPVVVVTDPKVRQDYLASLAAEIQHCKYYPRRARRLREEGRVVVSFVIRKDGELADIAVSESSGYRRLDEAAMKTLQRVSPFKPIPEGLGRDQWAISVPILFSLRS